MDRHPKPLPGETAEQFEERVKDDPSVREGAARVAALAKELSRGRGFHESELVACAGPAMDCLRDIVEATVRDRSKWHDAVDALTVLCRHLNEETKP